MSATKTLKWNISTHGCIMTRQIQFWMMSALPLHHETQSWLWPMLTWILAALINIQWLVIFVTYGVQYVYSLGIRLMTYKWLSLEHKCEETHNKRPHLCCAQTATFEKLYRLTQSRVMSDCSKQLFIVCKATLSQVYMCLMAEYFAIKKNRIAAGKSWRQNDCLVYTPACGMVVAEFSETKVHEIVEGGRPSFAATQQILCHTWW